MRKIYILISLFFICTFTNAQISLVGPYSQNFNSLASAGSSSTLPAGWLMLETSTNANTTYTAGTGSSNAGDTYSFGATANSDRAFGGLRSSSLIPFIGASFINNTGAPLTSVLISYTGEQWRAGVANRNAADRLDFQFSTNATTLNSGTWIDVNPLDFNSPNILVATTGALDGNSSTNKKLVSGLITGINVPVGATFFIRWTDFDIPGSDDGLAIDDFSISKAGGISINNVTQTEGNTGTGSFDFTISLSEPAGPGGVSFDIATENFTAVSPSDYTGKNLLSQTIAEGSMTYSFSVLANGDMMVEPDESFKVNLTNVVGADIIDAEGIGTILNDDCEPTHSIAQIEGSGITSPFLGNIVTVQGIVTGRRSNGFFIQTPDTDVDEDPATSEGIFVFTSSAPPASAAVGNKVCVTGSVTEFVASGAVAPLSQTEITSPSIVLLSTNNTLPAAVLLTAADTDPVGGLYQLEKYEGMRVQVNSLTVVGATQGNKTESTATSTSNGYFHAVITGVARPFREPGIEMPDNLAPSWPATVDRWDANPEVIAIGSNYLGGPVIDVNASDVLSNVTGVLDYRERSYAIDIDPAYPPTVIVNRPGYTPVPSQTSQQLTVASFNLERFFDDRNDPTIGEPILTTTAYNNRLNKASLAIRNALNTPDIIGVVEIENLSVLQTLANKINADAVAGGNPNPNYTAYLVEGNDVGGIDVGFLVKQGRVAVSSVIQYGKTTTFVDPNDNSVDILNDRPPLVLSATFTTPGCSNTNEIMVIVNHLRSLIDIEDQGASGNRVRAKRKAQAEYLANLIQGFQTANPNVKIISVGDYNAFQFNDGYVNVMGTITGNPSPASNVVLSSPDLVNPDLLILANSAPANEKYSFVFDGNAQELDHIVISQNLLPALNAYHIARLNADFAEVLRSDPTRPERLSDHDAAVAYFLFPDLIVPEAKCKPVTVTLSNGSATITSNDVDNGSTDNCGIASITVSPSIFNCSNIGANNVTLTVTDNSNNVSTCTAVVTVVGQAVTCSINAVPSNNINTGGIPTNLYLGYGPQSLTLNSTVTGGSSFTYSWTGTNLSCTNCASPVFTPTAQGVYTLTLLATNEYGCSTTCSITIYVFDVRATGNNPNKIYVCHNGNTLSVSTNAVAAHLNHGDQLGTCGQSLLLTSARMESGNETALPFSVIASPNPSTSEFRLQVNSSSAEPVLIRILDLSGKTVRQFSTIANTMVKSGAELQPGIYFAEVSQGLNKQTIKLLKTK